MPLGFRYPEPSTADPPAATMARPQTTRHVRALRRLAGMLGAALLLTGTACGGNAKPVRTSGQITWAQAKRLLEDCRVTSIGQTHSRLVTLRLKGGETAHTTEPQIDDIFRVLNLLPRSCAPKAVATE